MIPPEEERFWLSRESFAEELDHLGQLTGADFKQMEWLPSFDELEFIKRLLEHLLKDAKELLGKLKNLQQAGVEWEPFANGLSGCCRSLEVLKQLRV